MAKAKKKTAAKKTVGKKAKAVAKPVKKASKKKVASKASAKKAVKKAAKKVAAKKVKKIAAKKASAKKVTKAKKQAQKTTAPSRKAAEKEIKKTKLATAKESGKKSRPSKARAEDAKRHESVQAAEVSKGKVTASSSPVPDKPVKKDSKKAKISERTQAEMSVDEMDDIKVTPTILGVDRGDEDEEVVLTDAEGRRYCRVRDCDQVAVVDGYCRYHYLLLWKRIQVRKKILADGKLGFYVEELTSRYPDKFLEMIWRDLRSEKDFLGAIQELEIDESGSDSEYEEDTQSFIDEVRGMGGDSGSASDSDDDY